MGNVIYKWWLFIFNFFLYSRVDWGKLVKLRFINLQKYINILGLKVFTVLFIVILCIVKVTINYMQQEIEIGFDPPYTES